MSSSEVLTMIGAGAFLQLALIKYYFHQKRKFMQGLINTMKDGEVS